MINTVSTKYIYIRYTTIANILLVVEIDFCSPHFNIGSNQYNRLKWCLENTLTDSFKMVFCATDKCKLNYLYYIDMILT